MKRKLILLGLIIVLASCTTPTQHTPTNTEQITIGAITPLTGWGAYWGNPVTKGMKLAAKQINTNTSYDQHIKIQVEDSKGKAQAAAKAAKKLVTMNKIDAAMVDFAPPTKAAAPILQNNNVPFIYNAGTVQPLTHQYAFKSYLDIKQGCRQLLQTAKQRGDYDKIAVIINQQGYSQECLQGVRSVTNNITVINYNFGNTDFRTHFLKAKQSGADAIVTALWGNEAPAFFKQKKQAGANIPVFCGSASECLSQKVRTQQKLHLDTLAFDYGNLTNTAFAQTYRDEHPNATIADIKAAAHGYETVQLFAQAFEQCKQNNSQCVKQALQQIRSYPTALHSNGFHNRKLQINTQVYTVQQNKLKPVTQ